MEAAETFHYLDQEPFSFACHPALPCFTECCRDLKLILTPYDLLRLKHRLGLSSGDFLDRFTEIRLGEHRGFPGVLLTMRDDERRTCPFVSPSGCRVYEDRPSACRIYPVGRASSMTKGQSESRQFYFMVRESHCRGFQEPTRWTIESWSANQGLEIYTFFNDLWTAIITHKGSLGPQEFLPKKLQMFFMASYNLDQFRQFIFGSKFLQRFDLDRETLGKIENEDEALLKLAFDWLNFALFGEKTLLIRKDNV
jgi:hypothetical protein